MSDYRRLRCQGGCYFFTVVTYQRLPLLTHPDVRTSLRRAIIDVRKTLPFDIDAWVLLPDHLHCIWTLPEGDDNFSARWSKIKRLVSRDCRHLVADQALSASQKSRGEILFWQRRFWEHQIRCQQDFNHHLNYVHFNPVKHGYCDFAQQWQYSTMRRYIKEGVYPDNWGDGIDIPDDIGFE